jgi:hypothetical protein
MSARRIRRLANRSAIRAATLVGVEAARCVQLNGLVWGADAFTCRAATNTAPGEVG